MSVVKLSNHGSFSLTFTIMKTTNNNKKYNATKCQSNYFQINFTTRLHLLAFVFPVCVVMLKDGGRMSLAWLILVGGGDGKAGMYSKTQHNIRQ